MMPLLMTTVMTLVPPERARQDDGQYLHRHVGGAGDRSGRWRASSSTISSGAGCSSWCCRFRWVRWRSATGMMLNVSTPRYAPLDVLSVILSALAFGGIVYGLSSLVEAGAPVPIRPGCRWASVSSSMVVFVWRQIALARKGRGAARSAARSRQQNFTISMGMISILMLAMFGTIILLPIYLVQVLGFDTLQHRPAAAAGQPADGPARPVRRPAVRQGRPVAADRARRWVWSASCCGR